MSKVEHTYIESIDTAARQMTQLLNAGLRVEGKRVLDLGCGTGTYARIIAEMGATSVVGVDCVLGNIKTACKLNSLSNVEFFCADIEDWAIRGTFDMIFMRGTSYYLEAGIGELISRFVGILPPGGELFITFMNSGKQALFINAIKRFAEHLPEILRPVFRNIFAALYYCMAYVMEGGKSEWRLIKGKMNTLFFPLKHFTSPEEARLALESGGFKIAGVYKGQGQNPDLSDEYGVWAVLR